MRHLLISLLLAGLTGAGAPAMAWDSVGHRASAMVAVERLQPGVRERLVAILREHPRFEQDFMDQVPGFIDTGDALEFESWLLGQAAFWPDIVRGLPDAERNRYHRGNWHYIDGAWLRGAATAQGNVYVGIDPQPAIEGRSGAAIGGESEVDNVVLALDYNIRVLADPAGDPGRRAVALCWVLHLVGDIHQPLHTGSLFSARQFATGDAGGNGIRTAGGNLHAIWDRALREQGVLASVDAITGRLASANLGEIEAENLDWTAWMRESRALLTSIVYPEAVLDDILAAERGGGELGEVELSENYLAEMREIATERLGLAGVRMARLLNALWQGGA